MKRLRIRAGSGIVLVLALSCLFGSSSPSRYVLAQASDPQASVVPAGLTGTPAGTVFTYQGQLIDGGAPANGSYDFVFELFEVATGDSHMGKVNVDNVPVTDGLFTVQLDFGAGKFTGDARWLEIYVRPGASEDPDPYVVLAPRQPLTPAPHAINASTVGGLAASEFAATAHNHWGQVWTGSGKALDLTGSAPAPILAATNTSAGSGIAGISTASNGVYGETASTLADKAAVYGAATDVASGVYGESAHGDGVSGKGGDGFGDFGGRFTGFAGVRGEGGAGVGGYFTSTSNDAIRAEGDVTITGDLTVLGTATPPHYAQTVIVATSGGDFTSIQAAVDSIDDYATALEPYLVWVAPGVYEEMVELSPNVHLQGAGREATIVTSNVGNSMLPLSEATLVLASSTSVRDLSIENTGTSQENIAVLVPDGVVDGVVDALVADVTAWAQGAGDDSNNYGVFVGESAEVWLENVTARGENGGGAGYCYGLYISYATVHILGGNYHGLPSVATLGSRGIAVVGSTAAMDAEDVTALGVGGQNYNYGLYIDGGSATLRGGSFTGRGGQNATGIDLSSGALTASAVMVLAEEATTQVKGLHFSSAATATLYGGSFIGRSGLYTMGISGFSGTLAAEDVTCVAELGSGGSGTTRGLSLIAQAAGDPLSATLHGGSFTARNHNVNDAEGVFVSSNNAGVVTLVADHISAAGTGSNSRGLEVSEAANIVEISESVLRGANNSVKHNGGTVTVANARLAGVTSGTITCVAVSLGTAFYTNVCPGGGE